MNPTEKDCEEREREWERVKIPSSPSMNASDRGESESV